MDTAPARGARRTSYSSPRIHERRRKILQEARKLVSEGGMGSFNMDELAARAGVAKRTLYNAFQNKERVLATAVHDYFNVFLDRQQTHAPIGSLQHMIELLSAIARRGQSIKNYNRTLLAIYYSPDIDHEIWQTIHDMGMRLQSPYVMQLKARRQLQPWMTAEKLLDDLVRFRYATGNDWCNGRLSDSEYLPTMLTGLLCILAGATRGAARQEVEAMLALAPDFNLSEANAADAKDTPKAAAKAKKPALL